MVVDEQQSGNRIDVRPGEVVTIRLKENPTTGYRWAIEQAGGLQLEGDRHAGMGPAPGAGGMRELNFRAQVPGDHVLRLKQWRDWQGDASVIGRFQLSVHVG